MLEKFKIYAVILCATFSSAMQGSFLAQQLETERLTLRAVELSDAEALAGLMMNPDVTKLTGMFPPINKPEEVKDYVRDYLVGNPQAGIAPRYFISWIVIEKSSNRAVGLISFVAYVERHQRAELGYALVPECWNKGYGTEASKEILRYAFAQGLVRIFATVDPRNGASERVLQKLGMTCEGLMRSYMIIRGERVDRKMYALVA